jgi:tetratricopeptide (TPR) repeat protein
LCGALCAPLVNNRGCLPIIGPICALSSLREIGFHTFFTAQALALVQDAQDTRLARRLRTNLGILYRELGELSQALRCFEENLPSARQFDDDYNIARYCVNIGLLRLLLVQNGINSSTDGSSGAEWAGACYSGTEQRVGSAGSSRTVATSI